MHINETFEAIGSKLSSARFENTTFKGKVFFGKNQGDRNPKNRNAIGHSQFEGASSFENCLFEQEIYFKDCEFKQISFKNAILLDNAYFNNSYFEGSADFHECEFKKVACFYGVRFDIPPNFSQAVFGESPNLVNSSLNFGFEYLKHTITNCFETHEDKRTDKTPGTIPGLYSEKSMDKHANDFRDSFRLFKNALIKDNNILDASQCHKNELYCKEIELDSKENKSLSERIDKILLGFYRITSDHHTDVPKSFHSLLVVIGIFGILSGLVVFAFNACHLGYLSLNPHALMENYNTHIRHYVATNACCVMAWNILLLLAFAGLFAVGVLYARKIFTALGYFVSIALLIVSPKYLVPASGLFTGERAMLDPLSVIGGIYTILFAFMLYSFIKTIRKNSIIPS